MLVFSVSLHAWPNNPSRWPLWVDKVQVCSCLQRRQMLISIFRISSPRDSAINCNKVCIKGTNTPSTCRYTTVWNINVVWPMALFSLPCISLLRGQRSTVEVHSAIVLASRFSNDASFLQACNVLVDDFTVNLSTIVHGAMQQYPSQNWQMPKSRVYFAVSCESCKV